MSPEYPYQLVAFLNKEPVISEGVYQGQHGWYPQIALKRRFNVTGMNEEDLLSMLRGYVSNHSPVQLITGKLIKPDSMPVRVVEILNQDELKRFHQDFIRFMGERMVSRFPEREGENYLPHITAEFNERFVIDVDAFANKQFTIHKLCLIKDEEDTDSHVVAYFNFKNST